MGFQVEHPVHGKEDVLQSMSIESGYLQPHRMMSFFQIQATGSKPTSGISISGKARPGPITSFLRHCNGMESPPNPSYLHGGPQPAGDILDLNREASMENRIELQRYAERLQFEATCLRLWSNGIQDQIMEETQQVQTWISR